MLSQPPESRTRAARALLGFFIINCRLRRPAHCYHYKKFERRRENQRGFGYCFLLFFPSVECIQKVDRTSVHFDGELLIVSFVVYYLQ